MAPDRRGRRVAAEVLVAVLGALALIAIGGSPWTLVGLAVVAIVLGSSVSPRRHR